MNNFRFKLLMAGILSVMLLLSGCGDVAEDIAAAANDVGAVGTGDGTETGELNDDGIDTGIAATATTVAGKVTLSSILSSKARKKAAHDAAIRKGKPGSKAYNKAISLELQRQKAVGSRAFPTLYASEAFSNGDVYLYNASHPEWTKPIAQTTTDANGQYTLSTLSNAADNGNAYTDGDKIPGGNYTVLAFTKSGLFPDLVALQSVVSEFAGDISGINLEAQKSTASPTITSMLGVSKNTDGTQTWGGSSLVLSPNAAVNVSFSMPMFREAITDTYLKIESTDGGTVPTGQWTLSADWLTATYYLNDGQFWDPGKTYTLTVVGTDGELGILGSIYNIFARFLESSGVGTFKIIELEAGQSVEDAKDVTPPTALKSSPAGKTDIEVTTPIRIISDEIMDINGLRLRAEPSLGAQPGVLFVGPTTHPVSGEDAYEYEFVLGEPLKLATSYTIEVAGGTDLAGNKMDVLNASFSTEETSEGIAVITLSEDDEGYAEAVEEVNNQADVKDVFGKWVRGFNDRNLPQVQGLMHADFGLGYNTTDGFNDSDKNRDGSLDLDEFTEMLTASFLVWDKCSITMNGSVVVEEDGTGISVVLPVKDDATGEVLAPATADFAFKLASSSSSQDPSCKQAAVDQNYFANLVKVNGSWKIERASEGVDNREVDVTAAARRVVNLVQPEDDPKDIVIGDDDDLVFEWTEFVDTAADPVDASAYIWIVFDDRKPESGMAFIIPPTITSLNIPSDIDNLVDSGVIANVSEAFKFTESFDPRDGSVLLWQVAALDTNTVDGVSAGRNTSLPDDVIAMSELRKFTIPGEYAELGFTVKPNSSSLENFKATKGTAETYADRLDGTDGAVETFDEFIHGFNVDNASFATVTFDSPSKMKVVDDVETIVQESFGFIEVNGNTRIERKVKMIDQGDGTREGSVTVVLNRGNNNVMIADAVPCWFDGGKCDGGDDIDGIKEHFNITTTGGIKPVLVLGDGTTSGIATVDADGVETAVVANQWNWYETSDAVSLNISGTVDFTVGALNGQKPETVNVWLGNEAGAHAKRQATIDSDSGEFSFNIDLFAGENWINVETSICMSENTDGWCDHWNQRRFEVFLGMDNSGKGATYTPPFGDIVVTDKADTTIVIPQGDNWGDGGRWDASAATSKSVTITGKLEFASDATDSTKKPRYNIGSEGGWQEGQLPVAIDGTFELTVDLFNGDNWLNIQDISDNNYHMSIFTSEGQVVVRPEVTKINDATIEDPHADHSVATCSVTIEGTAQEGNVRAFWEAEDEVEVENDMNGDGVITADETYMERKWYREEVNTEATLADDAAEGAKATFSVTLPLIGSTDANMRVENRIHIEDKAYNGMGIHIRGTGDCAYTSPKIGVTNVYDDGGVELVNENAQSGGGDMMDNRGRYVSATTVSGKAFPNSVGLSITSPADDTANLGTGTVVSGNVNLTDTGWAATSVLRIMVTDASNGDFAGLATSHASDPMLSTVGDLGSTFTVDGSSGDFSTTVDLDSGKPWIINVMIWDDVAADPDTADPIAGHEIPVNGAVLSDGGAGGECNPDIETCDGGAGGTGGGDTTGGGTGGGDCIDCGGSQQVETDAIIIAGTSTVADRTVFIEVESCGGTIPYETTASSTPNSAGLYEWSFGDAADLTVAQVLVYDGWNRIRAHLGDRHNFEQSFEIELDASSTTPDPDPIMQIGSIAGAMTDGTSVTVSEVTDPNKPAPCGQSFWDAGDADTMTVTLTTGGLDVGGEWNTEGANGFFQFENGTVDITLPNLFTGENRFQFWDWAGNSHEITVETTGGTERPEFVVLTTDGSTALADPVGPGQVDVTVVIKGDPASTGEKLMPVEFGMDVWIGGMGYTYVNQSWMLNGRFGEVVDLTPVLDSANQPTGDYSFTITLDVPADQGDSTAGQPIGIWGWLGGEIGGEAGNPGRWTHYNFEEKFNDNCTDC